jgi:hypothetical protein
LLSPKWLPKRAISAEPSDDPKLSVLRAISAHLKLLLKLKVSVEGVGDKQ